MTPEQRIQWSAWSLTILDWLDDLPDDVDQVVDLLIHEQLGVNDVALLLQITHDEVRRRWAYARWRLIDVIGGSAASGRCDLDFVRELVEAVMLGPIQPTEVSV